jgi:hypothetical protein
MEIARRMTKKNPMRSLESRQKMTATLRRIGHQPKVRGGNGTGPTAAEQALLRAFPQAKNNFGVSLGRWTPGYPKCYKVDVAFPDIKLAVECDGRSHQMLSRQIQDKKKEAKLTSLGWLVLRLSNHRILLNTEETITELKSIISKFRVTRATS